MKKNKKMFAILTLVAFMMTLVPALAFAEASDLAGTVLAKPTATIDAEGLKLAATASADVYKVNVTTGVLGEKVATTVDTESAEVANKVVEGDAYVAITATTDITDKKVGASDLDKIYVASKADETEYNNAVTAAKTIADGDVKTIAAGEVKIAAAGISFTGTYDVYKLKTDNTVDGNKVEGSVQPVENDKYIALATGTDVSVKNIVSTEAAEKAYVVTAADVAKYTDAGKVEDMNNVSYSRSKITIDKDEVKIAGDPEQATLEFNVSLRDSANSGTRKIADGQALVIWAERTSKVLSDLDTINVGSATSNKTSYLIFKGSAPTEDLVVKSVTSNSGTVTLKGALVDLADLDDGVNADATTIAKAAAKGDGYTFGSSAKATVKAPAGKGKIEFTSGSSYTLISNGIDSVTIKGYLYDSSNNEVGGQTITISANKTGLSYDTSVKTDANGKFSFDVSATRANEYTLTLKSSNTENGKVTIDADAYAAQAITLVDGPGDLVKEGSNVEIQVTLKDGNGNTLKGDANKAVDKYADEIALKRYVDGDVEETEVIAGAVWSDADDAYIYTLDSVEEGTHKVMLYLENGKSITVNFKAVEMGDPVSMTLDYKTDSVGLGKATNVPTVKRYDANGVEETVSNADLKWAKSGAAILVTEDDTEVGTGTNAVKYDAGQMYKAGVNAAGDVDSSLVGNKIVVTVADEENDLLASATLTIAASANALSFPGSATAVVGETTSFVFNTVNGQGGVVPAGEDLNDEKFSYVVTKKPTDAIVTLEFNTKDLKEKGAGVVEFTSNKEGTVEATVMAGGKYTGVLTVEVGKTASAADSTATLIIGSNTFIANGKVATSDVAPFIQNGRTFLPVRALAEALGATVDFDEATNKITIKGNDVTAEMTLGSTIMTVNDEVVTMDTAAFATAEGRTVVPVRFAAQALGYEVDITTNADGTTATVTLSK